MIVYFFCLPTTSASEARYQHEVVCLAEGLHKLGVRCASNIDYWPLDPNRETYLLRHDPAIGPADADVVVVSEEYSRRDEALPEAVLARKRAYLTVFFDRQDGTRLTSFEPAFRAFDVVLRAQYSRSVWYPANFRPWAYGPSERIIAATSGEAVRRRNAILINHRMATRDHSVRIIAERRVVPRLRALFDVDARRDPHDDTPVSALDETYWFESGRRHTPSYFARLRSARACAAFCGEFVTRRPAHKEWLASRALRRALEAAGRASSLVVQWDSWRLWESLAAGAATFHLDAEKYGFVFPVAPTNWVHYIGLDLDRLDDAVERLRDDPGLVDRIGAAGRAWVLEHYAPRAVARRFLDIVAGAK